MTLLIAGLLLFTVAHLFPALVPEARDKLAAKLGNNRYRGLFSLIIVASLVIIVVGWRATTPVAGYTPPFAGGPVTSLVMFAAFVLFVAAQTRTNIRRFVRHPQMSAVILWSITHLLVNGETRSIVLFGGLGIWAVLEILLCNRRDGAWTKPDPAPRKWDVITVGAGAAGFLAIALLHQTLFGVPPFAG